MVLIASHPVMANISAPNSDDYCATMTEKKQILLGYALGLSPSEIRKKAASFDTDWCKTAINKIQTNKDIDISFTPFAYTKTSDGDKVPVEQQSYDLSIACHAKNKKLLYLANAADWRILNCIQDKEVVTHISIRRFPTTPFDMSLLLQFPNLDSVTIDAFISRFPPQFSKIANFASLLHIKKLAQLEIRAPLTAQDLAIIGQLTRLTKLRIGYTNAMKLRYLQNLTHLTELDFTSVNFEQSEDIKGIERLSQLTFLDFLESNINNNALPSIATLTQLEKLYLDYTPNITTIAPLVELPHLADLQLRYTGITDITPLANAKLLGKARNKQLAEQEYAPYIPGILVHGDLIKDFTPYYDAGGEADFSGDALACSPRDRAQYLEGKRCTAAQRTCPLSVSVRYPYIHYPTEYVLTPLCLWWHDD